MQTKFPSRQRARRALKKKSKRRSRGRKDAIHQVPRLHSALQRPRTRGPGLPGSSRRPRGRPGQPAGAPIGRDGRAGGLILPLRPPSARTGQPGSHNAGDPALPSPPRSFPSPHRGLRAPPRPRGPIAASPGRPCSAPSHGCRPPALPSALPPA